MLAFVVKMPLFAVFLEVLFAWRHYIAYCAFLYICLHIRHGRTYAFARIVILVVLCSDVLICTIVVCLILLCKSLCYIWDWHLPLT